jgi:hypothetical protein
VPKAKKKGSTVPETRDGDQFHYRWAARRCLRLLHPNSELQEISIEGPSNSGEKFKITLGELVIDVAEYFGSNNVIKHVNYCQLKHSTSTPSKPRTLTGLEKTLLGFAERFRDLKQTLGKNFNAESINFCFVSNFPVSPKLAETIEDLSGKKAPRHATEAKRLREKVTCLNATELSTFLSRFSFDCTQGNFWEQRQLLQMELSEMLGGSDSTSTNDLLQLVTRKATSEGKPNNRITQHDVLHALGCTYERLFPATSGIEPIVAIERTAFPKIIAEIVQCSKTLVHADGGVGKTIFSSCIGRYLPNGSVCIVFDCFANGDYRNPSQHRHRHDIALVQIANELAGKGLCLPLIPQRNTDKSSYLRAFFDRLKQSSKSIRATSSASLLCIVVDAADNAQMAANEDSQSVSFARDLLREQMPEGVHLVLTARTYRRDSLNPPPECHQVELPPFDDDESLWHLRSKFSGATQNSSKDFNYLTHGNPRVQAIHLNSAISVQNVFNSLGNSPQSIDDAIQMQLNKRLALLLDSVERDCIEKLCQYLATLRPRIPVNVLAQASRIDESLIRSFATDFSEALQIRGNSIQFTNEPVKTWFIDKFQVAGKALRAIVQPLIAVAPQYAYLARVLPRLMWEADLRNELIALVLNSESLPSDDAVEVRMIEHERLQFSLKACLREKRYLDAAKLSFKAGGENAAEERQREILRKNTDLTGRFRSEQATQEYLATRPFEGRWQGSKYVHEASLLSGFSGTRPEARLKYIEAWKWIGLPRKWQTTIRHPEDDLNQDDIVALAWSAFNLGGVNSLIENLSSWSPKRIEFEVGSIIVRRLIEHGHVISAIEIGAESVRAKSLGLALAALVELRDANYKPEKSLSSFVFAKAKRVADWGSVINTNEEHKAGKLKVALRISESATIHRLAKNSEISDFLTGFIKLSISLPLDDHFRNSFNTIFTARVMSVVLKKQSMEAQNLSDEAFRDSRGVQTKSDDYRLKETVARLAPCVELRIGFLMGKVSCQKIAQVFDDFIAVPAQSVRWSEHYHIQINSLAVMWLDLLVEASVATQARLKAFELYFANPEFKLWSWASLAFRAGVSDEGGEACINFARRALEIQNAEFNTAEENCDFLIDLSRAVLRSSEAEAKEYFELAVSLAPSLGMEIIDRWNALAKVGRSLPISRKSVLAQKFAHCAFVSHQYMAREKYFDWDASIEALLVLCPASSIAVLSQWRDRGFGDPRRQLALWVKHALRLGAIAAEDAAALFPYRAYWDAKQLQEQMLSSSTDATQNQLLANYLHNYTLLENTDKTLLGEDLEKHASEPTQRPKTEQFDQSIFMGVDFTSAESLRLLRAKCRELRISSKDVWRATISAIPFGNRPNFLDAVASLTDVHRFEYQDLIDVIPEDWNALSVTASLKRLAKNLCERFYLDAHIDEEYGLSINRLAHLSQQNSSTLIDVILNAIGSTHQVLDSGRIFTCIALLRTKLIDSDAAELLDFALDVLLTKQLNAKSVPMRDFVSPPSITQGLAGFIWAGLGAIEVSERWEFAHAVCGICDLERTAVLDELMQFAATEKQDAFVHPEFRFYVEDAKQWLLYALERSASRKPKMVARCRDFLKSMLGTSHVIHRSIAARTLLQLQKCATFEGVKTDANELTNINCSKFESVLFTDRSSFGYFIIGEEAGLHFDIDFPPYWFKPLGAMFNLDEMEISALVATEVKKFFGVDIASFRIDQRSERKRYDDRSTYHSHGSYPKVTDQHFYMSYHGMMRVAGMLLKEKPTATGGAPWDSFPIWLSRHELSFTDGSWLFDQRTAVPPDVSQLFNAKGTDATNPDTQPIELVWQLPNGFVVWGDWNVSIQGDEFSVSIQSALIDSEKAEPSMRTYQQLTDCSDYRIPAASDDNEFVPSSSALRGWVELSQRDSGRDESDPWSGNLDRAPRPAKFVCTKLGLEFSAMSHFWESKELSNCKAESWSVGKRDTDDSLARSTNGTRLIANSTFIEELLKRFDKQLIVKVHVSQVTHRDTSREAFVPHKRVRQLTELYLIKPRLEIVCASKLP